MTQIKTFLALTLEDLDSEINSFINLHAAEVVDVKFQVNKYTYYAMLIYKVKGETF